MSCSPPTAESLVTVGTNATVEVWDTATGRPRLAAPIRHPARLWDANLSPDDQLLALGGDDNVLRIWRLADGTPVGVPLRHPEWVFSGVFSPDGTCVLTACRDGQARLWDWRTGHLACPPFSHQDELNGVAFSPDGQWMLTASRDATGRILERLTGRPVTPPIRFASWGSNVIVTPDGRHIVFGGLGSAIVSRDLRDLSATDALRLDDLCTLCEVNAGCRVERGDLVTLTSQEWLDRWTDMHGRHPELFALEEPAREANSIRERSMAEIGGTTPNQ